MVLAEAKGKKVMIVNTKKGGHAFLGLYLAKRLLGKGFGVTIFNDGDPVRLSLVTMSSMPAYKSLSRCLLYHLCDFLYVR